MSWRQIAEQVRSTKGAGDNRDVRDNRVSDEANVPIISIVPPPLDPVRLQRIWRAGLADLDDGITPAGWTIMRWQTLCDDAVWIFNQFGERAACDGWSTADLFGIDPIKPHWGGIADRLRGARNLVMGSEQARWRLFGQPESYVRGVRDLEPFWGAQHG